MKNIKNTLVFLLSSLLLAGCAKEASTAVINTLENKEEGVVYSSNIVKDYRSPDIRSDGDDDEDEQIGDVNKVILHYVNDDNNCATRAFYIWCNGVDGAEYSSKEDGDIVKYETDGSMMTITIDFEDARFAEIKEAKPSSLMYIIKFQMISAANLNWGGQSEDVELKFSNFPPVAGVVEVWCTPAAGGGIAQFATEEETKVDGVKLANFIDYKTIACSLTPTAGTVEWELYAFDETYFKVKSKNRAAIKKNYIVKTGQTSQKEFNISLKYNAHMNVVYSIVSKDVDSITGLSKTVFVSFEQLYFTTRFEEKYNYFGDDLGMSYTAEATTFKVWSPVAANITLLVYDTDTTAAYNGSDKYKGYHMLYQPNGIWAVTIKGDLKGKYYNYQVDTWAGSSVSMDPYATSAGANGLRAFIYDKESNEAKPEDHDAWDVINGKWDNTARDIKTPQELAIYEVHIADFTGDESWISQYPNSSEPNREPTARGTFNAFVEENTKYTAHDINDVEQTVATGFDHLKALGVNAVQLMPVFDSDNDEVKNKKYNWGYNPQNYNVVEGVYSSNPHDGYARMREYKNLVLKCAQNGMRVIMDVVYNHVSSVSSSPFNKLMPRYFFRYSQAGDEDVKKGWIGVGELYDGSGCHNEFKSEATMARKYIVDSVCMWAREYNVKGFRFDLMALIDGYTLKDVKKELYKIDPSIYVYGEGWTADRFHGKKTWYDLNGDGVINYATETEHVDSFGAFAVPGGDEHNLHNNHGYQVYSELYNEEDEHSCWLGAFDGSGRDALKGDNNPGYGFINKGRGDLNDGFRTSLENIIYGKRADGEGANPKQVVQYASCHDNYTLRDHLYATLGGAEAPYLIDVLHGVMAVETLVFASNSAAFMLGGEELLRTKEVIFDAEHPNAASNNVTAEEFDKIPVTTYREHYGHKLSHNSYNSPLNVNSFKWGNKVSITDDHNQTINMKTENLTAQFASLIQLHKTMPKYRYDQISTIFNTHKTTIGNDIINFSWHGVIWNSDLNYGAGGDEETMSVVCIQYDEWFVFACARDFGYVRNADINTWTERASGGVHSFNSGTNCLDLGDGGTGIGLSCVVYERG